MPKVETTIRRGPGPTPVPEILNQPVAVGNAQPTTAGPQQITHTRPQQLTRTQANARVSPGWLPTTSGPALPVPAPHQHPHVETSNGVIRNTMKLRQENPGPQAAPKELYYYVHEDDGRHVWMTEKQLNVTTAALVGMSCGVFNDQNSGYLFFWRHEGEQG